MYMYVQWFPVIYRPPENIILSQVEAAVGAYIYADSNYTGLKGYFRFIFKLLLFIFIYMYKYLKLHCVWMLQE